jgi:TctA family transporter
MAKDEPVGQKWHHTRLKKTEPASVKQTKTTAKATIGATIMGFLAAFLPGFGSSQAAIIATQFLRNIGDKHYHDIH